MGVNSKKSFILILFLFILFFFIDSEFVNAADCGGETQCNCADFVIENYTMTDNLTNCGNYGLLINADHVTIDCDGYTISGRGSSHGIQIHEDNYTTVKNCDITNFQHGIVVYVDAHYSNIYNNILRDNTYGGIHLDTNSPCSTYTSIWNNYF